MISTWLRLLSSRSLRRPASAKPRLDRYEDLIVPTFTPFTFSSSGATGPANIATGDLRMLGLGQADVVTANQGSNDATVYLNDGTGGFLPPVNYPAGTMPNSLAIGDLNGDGLPDIVVANDYATLTSVTVLFNNPSNPGTFEAPVSVPVGDDDITNVALADMNGDGLLDIVTANVSSSPLGSVSVVLNNPAAPGTFAAPLNYPIPSPIPGGVSAAYGLAVAEFFGDPLPSVAVSDDVHGLVYILRDVGGGALDTPTQIANIGAPVTSLAAGVLDNSGNVSLVTANNVADTVSVLLNTGGGVFAPPVQYPVGDTPAAVAVGHVGNSGLNDIVTANFGDGANDVSLLYNDQSSPGTFLPAISVPTNGMGTSGVAIDDFLGDNGTDNLLDIFTSNGGSNNMTVLDHSLPIPPAPQPGSNSLWFQEAVQYGTAGSMPGHEDGLAALRDASRMLNGRSEHRGLGDSDF
jgi:hypothetical protein